MKSANDIMQRAHEIRGQLIRENCGKLVFDPIRQKQVEIPTIISRIKFEVSTRMTSSAGRAWPYQNRVILSYPFYASESNFISDLFETVTHEIAHVVVPKIRGIRGGHSPEWKMMHRQFGGTGERCHNLELAEGFTARRDQTVEALCQKCMKPIRLGPTQYKRHQQSIKLGGPGYTHGSCPSSLTNLISGL